MLTSWQLVQRKTGEVVVESLELADGFWSRFVGLQFRANLPSGRGLLLVPCSSVHTFFVRFSVDLVMLDDQGQVVAVRKRVRPWRMVLPVRRAHAVLEICAGSARVSVGDYLALGRAENSMQVPPSLEFLAAQTGSE